MGSGGRRKRDRGIIRIPGAKSITAVDTARDTARVTAGAGNGGGSKLHEQCQRFGLVRVTDAASRAAAGMAISGIFNGARVTVRSQFGELGDAPSQAARYFMEQRDLRGGGRLTGIVLKQTPHDVRVRLCLK